MNGRTLLTARLGRWLVSVVSIALLAAATVAEKPGAGGGAEVSFRVERAGPVFIHIQRADGTLVRRLVQGQPYPAGAQKIAWDGRADDGSVVEPGEYRWRGLSHEGIGLKLRGWAVNGGATPWRTPDGEGGWGGDAGVPSAVTADAERVYLGWSLAEQGKEILACDLEGRVQWSHHRAAGASGCKALAVDDGILYVLGGAAGIDAEGGAVYRLNAQDGQVLPWPDGKADLKIASLWPADGRTKPPKADAMAVRHGHIYLTFTSSEFLAVLDTKTGAYLQTVVGAPPGQIDVVATKTDLPDAPGKLVDADFLVVSLGGGVLGRVLMAHDPIWVVTSELSPVVRDVRISALSVMGDAAKHHRHTVFTGLDVPFHQVQARHLLGMENVIWAAGRPGGRPLRGPWQADALRAIRGLALDAAGQLWVAEGDEFPRRFSVWDTTGQQGRLVREFFGPAESNAPGSAINPLDPDLMFAQGCEWRIDPKTGQAKCLGVVTREAIEQARYAVGENGHAYLVTYRRRDPRHRLSIFERVGDGDYKLRARTYCADKDGAEVDSAMEDATQTIIWSDEDGDGERQPNELRSHPGAFVFHPMATSQGLTLQAERHGDASRYWLLSVESWTACDAPRFQFSEPRKLTGRGGPVSADGRMVMETLVKDGQATELLCREGSSGRERWRQSVAGNGRLSALPMSSARLAEPVGNVWLVTMPGGSWHLVTEDGFDLAQFLESDPQKIRWPREAVPGADMTHAARPQVGMHSMTQGIDGKLYLQAGDAAYWNLEVTGLDQVQALPGGSLVWPAAK